MLLDTGAGTVLPPQGEMAGTDGAASAGEGDVRLIVGEQVCRFEAIDGNPLERILDLDSEGLILSFVYLVWAGVGLGERRLHGIGSYKHMGGCHQGGGQVGLSRWVIRLVAWNEALDCLLELGGR